MSLQTRISDLATAVGEAIKTLTARVSALEDDGGGMSPSDALQAAILTDTPSHYWRLSRGPAEPDSAAFQDMGTVAIDFTIDTGVAGTIPYYSSLLGDNNRSLFFIGDDVTAGAAYAKLVIDTTTHKPQGDFSFCCIIMPQGDRYAGDRALIQWVKQDDPDTYFIIGLQRERAAVSPFMSVNSFAMGLESYVATNKPTFVHITKKNDGMSLWINGRLVYEDIGFYPDWNLADALYDVRLGTYGDNGATYRGIMSNMAMWYGVRLTEEQIVAHVKAAGLW